MTPSEIVMAWSAIAKNGDHDTHPRRPKPGSKVYTKLVQIYPTIFPSDPLSFPFITLFMVFYHVLKHIDPDFPDYKLFDPINLVNCGWSDALKQNYATCLELRNLLKFHFPPIERTEASIRDTFCHYRIPALADSSKWTKSIVLQFAGNKKLYDHFLFTKLNIIYAPDKVAFTFKEPLKTKVINHFQQKDRNFKFTPTNSEALLDLFLKFVQEEKRCLEPLNHNFLLCNEGSFLQNTFEHRSLIHVGQILQSLWMEMDLVFPPHVKDVYRQILIDTKNRHLAFIEFLNNQK